MGCVNIIEELQDNVIPPSHGKSPPLFECCTVLSPAVTHPRFHPCQSLSLTLLVSVQKQMPADEPRSTVTPAHACRCVLGSAVSLDGDGWTLETHLEFELCPSHWSPLTPLLDLYHKVSILKIKDHVCLQAEKRVWLRVAKPKTEPHQDCVYLHQRTISILLLRLDLRIWRLHLCEAQDQSSSSCHQT